MPGLSGSFLQFRNVCGLAPLLALFMLGCSGSEYRFGNQPSTITSVAVACSPTSLQTGQTSQCSATVKGTEKYSSAVTWMSSADHLTSVELTAWFTASPEASGKSVKITATSVQDPTKSGTATIAVNAAPNNVLPLAVDAGPAPLSFTATNQGFANVTVCVPNTHTCQTIDHVLVDTGSFGLRLLSSDSGGEFNLSLPSETGSRGNPLLECVIFGSGFAWGNVAQADITLAGEVASSAPVQVIIPSTSAPAVPGSCSSQTIQPNIGDSLSALGANGILGVGLFQQDCGVACTTQNKTIPDVYYDCRTFDCNPTYVTLAQQVTNPVSLFASDNNGVLIQLPKVPNGGSSSPSGNLIFGIGTQANNGLGSATVYPVPASGKYTGDIITTFNGKSYPNSFIDSGSNGIFFLDSATTGITQCRGQASAWYCPASSPDNLSATNQAQDANGNLVGTAGTVNFTVEDATTLFTTSNTAFSTLGGPFAGAFDWGLAFFYGRNVFTAIENMSTPGGAGPYYAY